MCLENEGWRHSEKELLLNFYISERMHKFTITPSKIPTQLFTDMELKSVYF